MSSILKHKVIFGKSCTSKNERGTDCPQLKKSSSKDLCRRLWRSRALIVPWLVYHMILNFTDAKMDLTHRRVLSHFDDYT